MSIWKETKPNGEVVEVEIPDPVADADEHVLQVRIVPDAKWHRSAQPHPLVTIDYDEGDRVVAVSFVGPVKDAVLNPEPFGGNDA